MSNANFANTKNSLDLQAELFFPIPIQTFFSQLK